MNITQSYKDLCQEIEIWKSRLETYYVQLKALRKLAKLDGPNDISGVDYTQPYVDGTSQIGFEEALEQISKIQSHIYLHQQTIKQMEKSKKQIKKRIKKLHGLDKKVVYMRYIEGKTLREIAEDLGYSYQYIKEVSAKNKTTY